MFLRPSLGLAALVSLAVVAAGCGGSSSGSGTSSTSLASTPSQLAYARCMRSHGVPGFPDPDSTGSIPKTQVAALRQSDPTVFDSAESACGHLLPSGGGNGETPAEIAQDWSKDRQFAKCMRRDGVPNWPDPTDRSPTDTRPVFRITAVGLNGNSPQLRAKAENCVSQLHMIGLPVAG